MPGMIGLILDGSCDIKKDPSAEKLLFPHDITPTSLHNNHNNSKARLFTGGRSSPTIWDLEFPCNYPQHGGEIGYKPHGFPSS